MIYIDVIQLYKLTLEVLKVLEDEDYSKSYEMLQEIAKILILRKNTSNAEWKLKITELILIGLSTPLKLLAQYDAEQLEITPELLAIILSDIDSFQTGLLTLLIPMEVVKYKFYPN